MEDEIIEFYNDDGTKMNPELVPKPSLCIICIKDDIGGEEELLCILNRNDQREEEDFKCGAYEPKFRK